MSKFMSCVTVVLLLFIVPASAAMAQTAMAAWHFNETSGTTAFDAIGNVHGTLLGNAAFDPTGITGGAVATSVFGNGFVDMGDHFGFGGGGTFSFVAWVRLNAGDTAGMLVTGRHQAFNTSGYWLGVNATGGDPGETVGGAMFFQAQVPNPVSGNLSIHDGNWHQLIGVHDSVTNQARLYVDGILRDIRPFNPFATSSANFAVGGALNGAGDQMIGTFNGFVDEVSLWEHALSPSEVTLLFNNPGATAVPEPTTLALSGLITLAAVIYGIGAVRRRKLLVAER